MNIDNTIVDPKRLKMIYDIAVNLTELDGDIAEIGVYKGGSAKMLAKIFANKKILLFDTFNGISPEMVGPRDDESFAGRFSDTSLEQVQKFLKDFSNIEYHQGIFPNTLGDVEPDSKFALVHVDCDLHNATKACCEFFYPRLVENGFIFFDDYSWVSGARVAINNYFSDKPDSVTTPNWVETAGGCFVQKS